MMMYKSVKSWAMLHNADVDVVVELLRNAGVMVESCYTSVSESNYKKIEPVIEECMQKKRAEMDCNLTNDSSKDNPDKIGGDAACRNTLLASKSESFVTTKNKFEIGGKALFQMSGKEILQLAEELKFPRGSLLRFAFFPKKDPECDLNGFRQQIAELKECALNEYWGRNNEILENYVLYTFARLEYEDEQDSQQKKIKVTEDAAIFNTGLVDKYYNPIYAYFEKNPNSDAMQEWFFRSFSSNVSEYLIKKFGSIENFPKPAEYSHDNSDFIVNPTYKIETHSNLDHILIDNVKRLPRRLLEKCGANLNEIESLKAPNDSYAYFVRNQGVLKDLHTHVSRATEDAIKRVRWNFKTATPIYFPAEKMICILLPLCFFDNQADAALVLKPVPEQNVYVQKTIFDMKMAYVDARLITRPDSDWLVEPKDKEITDSQES